jgi:predicted pyridoxine 5'-phosphate oxidase superfamily flavin-nucleotide-binding protein
MAEFYRELDARLAGFIEAQKIFFVATAARDGRVNLSPKGGDTLRVLDERTVAYLDMTGSGNETAAHLAVTGRLTMMFCSFDRTPLILRLYGQGEVVGRRHAQWSELLAKFPSNPGTRQIIRLAIDSVQTSCGYAVPEMAHQRDRDMLDRWAETKGPEGLVRYRRDKNAVSIDGLPSAVEEDPDA